MNKSGSSSSRVELDDFSIAQSFLFHNFKAEDGLLVLKLQRLNDDFALELLSQLKANSKPHET